MLLHPRSLQGFCNNGLCTIVDYLRQSPSKHLILHLWRNSANPHCFYDELTFILSCYVEFHHSIAPMYRLIGILD